MTFSFRKRRWLFAACLISTSLVNFGYASDDLAGVEEIETRRRFGNPPRKFGEIVPQRVVKSGGGVGMRWFGIEEKSVTPPTLGATPNVSLISEIKERMVAKCGLASSQLERQLHQKEYVSSLQVIQEKILGIPVDGYRIYMEDLSKSLWLICIPDFNREIQHEISRLHLLCTPNCDGKYYQDLLNYYNYEDNPDSYKWLENPITFENASIFFTFFSIEDASSSRKLSLGERLKSFMEEHSSPENTAYPFVILDDGEALVIQRDLSFIHHFYPKNSYISASFPIPASVYGDTPNFSLMTKLFHAVDGHCCDYYGLSSSQQLKYKSELDIIYSLYIGRLYETLQNTPRPLDGVEAFAARISAIVELIHIFQADVAVKRHVSFSTFPKELIQLLEDTLTGAERWCQKILYLTRPKSGAEAEGGTHYPQDFLDYDGVRPAPLSLSIPSTPLVAPVAASSRPTVTAAVPSRTQTKKVWGDGIPSLTESPTDDD